jgi:hypothetical protein
VVLDIPAGVAKLSFHLQKFRKDLVPEELVEGLQMGGLSTCLVSAAADENATGAVVPGDALGAATSAVEGAVADATENGAGTNVEVQFGPAVFFVPMKLVGESFTAAELDSMIEDGTVRLFFAKQNDPTTKSVFDTTVPAAGFAMSSQHHTIRADFEDGKVALLQVGADNSVAPDDAAATAAAEFEPDDFATAEDLAKRAGLCTLSVVEKGKLKLPRVVSSDLRILGPTTVNLQENRDEASFAGPDGWRAVVGEIKVFGHIEPTFETAGAELALRRDHLGPDADPAGFGASDAYPVFSLVVLCVGKQAAFQLVLSEVPPPEDGSELPVYTPAEALATVGQGFAVARTVAASLPTFTPPVQTAQASVRMLCMRVRVGHGVGGLCLLLLAWWGVVVRGEVHGLLLLLPLTMNRPHLLLSSVAPPPPPHIPSIYSTHCHFRCFGSCSTLACVLCKGGGTQSTFFVCSKIAHLSPSLPPSSALSLPLPLPRPPPPTGSTSFGL